MLSATARDVKLVLCALYSTARYLLLYVNSHYQKKKWCVFAARQWEVMHRRGGMEGDEYPFLGLIRLSGVAISVCFDLALNFPLFMHPLPSRVDPLRRIIFAMLVWQGCRLLPWPRSHHGSRGKKHNALLLVCLNSPPHPHSSRLFIFCEGICSQREISHSCRL